MPVFLPFVVGWVSDTGTRQKKTSEKLPQQEQEQGSGEAKAKRTITGTQTLPRYVWTHHYLFSTNTATPTD